MLLGHRGALGSIPSSTLQCLPKQQQQKQEGEPVWDAVVDLAGLPVPEHSCSLLPGKLKSCLKFLLLVFECHVSDCCTGCGWCTCP
jgi:hypothetical protein